MNRTQLFVNNKYWQRDPAANIKVQCTIYLSDTSGGETHGLPDALKQKTPNFMLVLGDHVTTPVLLWPQFLLGVSRGMTAVCSAVQPNLCGSAELFIFFDNYVND